jgi:ribonuclease P/MRP protein subunit RPP40
VLATDEEEKDLGLIFQNNLKFDKRITNCVNKANRMLGLIKRTFDYMDKEMLVTLYLKALVRPLLEYATPVWSP